MVKINHIAVYIKDLEEAKEFFIKYFDASSNEMYHNPITGLQTYFLSFGNDVRLEIMTRPELSAHHPEGYHYGYTHLAFSLGSREAVDKLTATLYGDGFKILSGPRVTGDGYYESCIEGIQNLILELTE